MFACCCVFHFFFKRNRNITSGAAGGGGAEREEIKENALISGARPLRNAPRILNLKARSISKQSTRPTNFQ